MPNIISFLETKLLSISLYFMGGCSWADIVNACRRYPMFAERQSSPAKEGPA